MELSTLSKTTLEKPTLEMPFIDKLTKNDTLFSVDSVTSTLYSGSGAVLVGSSAILNTSVFTRFSGGVSGSKYLIKIIVTTAGGDELEMNGILQVQDALF